MSFQNARTDSAMINEIMRDFTNITELAAIYVDVRGKNLSEKYNFSNFCKAMRSNKQCSRCCAYCDAFGGLEASKGGTSRPYRCHAGLVDFSTPIIRQGHLLGFIAAGQSMVTDAQLPFIAPVTDWKNDSTLKTYYNQLPAYTSEQLLSATKVLHLLAAQYFPEITNHEFILPELQTDQPDRITYRPEIKRALSFIDTHLSHQFSLRDIANHVYLSESYLSKLFKEDMGMSLVQYINSRKLEQAKIMLRNSDASIEAIAKNLGFGRTSYFCKIFKDGTAETPKSYRKKYK